MSEEPRSLEQRVLTTIRYARRQGFTLADVERCIAIVRAEEATRPSVRARTEKHA